MARRDLLQEARVTAAAEVAPQIAALSEALSQARSDRNAAIHTAAAGSKGIGRAINRAQGTIKRAYKDTAGLGAAPQSYSGGAYAGAAQNERAVTGTVLASSLANALKEGSDRRIEAAAGRAYRSAAAEGAYRTQVAGIQTKRQSVAAQEGLLAGAALSKLTEAAAGRKNQRILQSQRLDSQASLQTERLASQEAVAGARLQSSAHQSALGRRQQKLNRIAVGNRQDKSIAAADRRAGVKGANGGVKPTSAHVYKGRQSIQVLADHYKTSGQKMHKVAAEARKQGYPETIIQAASQLATNKPIHPSLEKKLNDLGYTIPPEWQGVTVKPHVRRRRSK